ncbi:hypothetical protein A4X06_0g544 [Tilletia controversa]|uniref:Transmembrane protein n=1 Tax=Tilletia controversa TaxID=13291 RepID=A0A8X7MZ72_9BASI|nr:hypothetical protein CF328_g502 [Tilletia controversa]KAE8255210.1 hypothetical protein A4X06_0g544 [Tilletia controversa]
MSDVPGPSSPPNAGAETGADRSSDRTSIAVPSSSSSVPAPAHPSLGGFPSEQLSTAISHLPTSPTSGLISHPPPPALDRYAIATRRNITPISILSPPSSTAFSPTSSSSIFSASIGPAPDEIPMLRSSSRTTFAPTGELLIDGLGVDGRDLRKGEMGWAEPFSPILLTSPITRRFSTRPNLDPVNGSLPAASTSVVGVPAGATLPTYLSPPTAAVPLPDVGASDIFPPDVYGTCGISGCQAAEGGPSQVNTSLGISAITIYDIVERRTCRPISLQDLRQHLLAQRTLHRADPNAVFGKKMQLPDLALLGGASDLPNDSSFLDWNRDGDPEKTVANSVSSVAGPSRKAPWSSAGKLIGKPDKLARSNTTGDEVDALDFVAVFNRYNRMFQALSKAQKLRSPHPAVFATPAEGPAQQRAKGDLDGAVTIEVAVRSTPHDFLDRSDSHLTNLGTTDQHSTLHTRKEITLFPAIQPLRQQFDEILQRFLGQVSDGSEIGSPTDAEKDEILGRGGDKDGRSKRPKSSSKRLRWMIDIGLLSEEQIALALSEAEITTHPQVLAPLADKVADYLNDHVVPEFLSGSTSNLSKATQLGRLTIGLICTVLAIIFTIMLCVNPSPFRPQPTPQNPEPDVSRWWILFTAPLWCAGVGYVLAAWTGVCVWLTIRGNHEHGDAGGETLSEVDWVAMMEEEDANRAGEGALLGRVLSSTDPALPWKRADRKSLMAPELANLLRRFIFLKPLPVAGPSTSGRGTLTLAMGEAEMNGSPSVRKGASPPTLALQHSKDPLDGRFSPTLSRVISTSGGPSSATKLEPLNEAKSVTFERSFSSSGAAMSSIGQVASGLPGRGENDAGAIKTPVTPQMSYFPTSFTSPTSLSPADRHSNTSTPAQALRPGSPNMGELWRTTSASAMSNSGMPVLPAVSVKSKKFPGFPVAVGMVQTNSSSGVNAPASSGSGGFFHSSPSAQRSHSIIAPFASTSAMVLEPSSSRAPSFAQTDAGVAYAASLYNMTTCAPPQPAPRRLLSAFWVSVRRWTGFAVNTKPVLDSRVRVAQQRAAMQSLAICSAATLVIMVMITALP